MKEGTVKTNIEQKVRDNVKQKWRFLWNMGGGETFQNNV